MSASIAPSEEELKTALVDLRAENPTLGIPKLHALLLSKQPSWIVSEKRTRKVVQSAGLTVEPPQGKNADPTHIYPSSKLVETLDVTKWTPKVAVKYFGKRKGKGLVAKEAMSEGEVVWKEDPFIIAPEWDIFDLQTSSRACAFCTTPLSESPLITRCPSTTVSSSSSCTARFCNRLCQSRSAKVHPLLCSSQNPASVPLLAFSRRSSWMGLHALIHCTARILLAAQNSDAKLLEEDWNIVSALAELSMEDRAKGTWFGGAEPDRATWKKAHQLFTQAFQSPVSAPDQKKLARLLKNPIPESITENIFPYDAFLRGLGRMSLNLEAHGGLYTLHSHLNHSCAPNLSARHADQRTALARLTLIARRDIKAGEELSVAYVNPSLGVKQRREELGGWGFGVCECEKCVKEEKEVETTDDADSGEADMEDLERELKRGLGVM